MTLIATNPATGQELARFDEASTDAVGAALDKAQDAFSEWRERPVAERAKLVRKVAGVLRSDQEELACLGTQEMGKILAESMAEVDKSAGFCEYYAEQGPGFLAPRRIEGGQLENWIRFDPLGVLLAVMPWNFPYVQVFRFAPPALIAGNVVLLKHASNIPQCALRIEELFLDAGLPQGVFQTLLVQPSKVEGLIADPRVKGVTLTGSDAAGSQVAAIAGRELKTSVMELGGSDAFIVLDDADVAHAAVQGCRARNSNAGQACISAKRFIILESIADAFEEALVEEVSKLRVGDPLDPDIDVGPLARQDLVEALESQVTDSVDDGAVVRTGGFDWEGPGSFVRPVVLTGVTSTMRVFREETFGPVAAVTRVPDDDTAIAMANDSEYGLGASVFSGDLVRARRVAERIDAGMVFINDIVVSDARLPFGGVKRSGYGRELGEWGIREFTDVKSVAISESPRAVTGGARPGANVAHHRRL
jgi:succinate-semialdehyde dehydrogenase/glutarate-semialdehyde dehydrogenase